MLLAQCKISVNSVIQRDQPKFLQPRCLGIRKLRRAQIIEHRSPPQAQSLSEQSRRALSVTELQRLLAQFQQTLELGDVDLVGADEQAVSGLSGNQCIPRPNAGQPAPKMRHMGTQCDIRAGGWRTVPQRIGDPACRDASIPIDQQEGKQLALFVPAKLWPLPPVGSGG
jgi:hypothetical protein